MNETKSEEQMVGSRLRVPRLVHVAAFVKFTA
jgi:hypothetical protein